MNIQVSGVHMRVSGALRAHVVSELEKLENHAPKIEHAEVVFAPAEHAVYVEATLQGARMRLHAEAEAGSERAAVEDVMARLRAQVDKQETRRQNRRRADHRHAAAPEV